MEEAGYLGEISLEEPWLRDQEKFRLVFIANVEGVHRNTFEPLTVPSQTFKCF